MGLNDELNEKWNKLVKKNKREWAKDLYELIQRGRYWDVSFDRYTKYRVFCIHFELQIKEVFNSAKIEFPELDLSLEDVSHDLYLSVTEDGDVIKRIEDNIESVIDSLPRA